MAKSLELICQFTYGKHISQICLFIWVFGNSLDYVICYFASQNALSSQFPQLSKILNHDTPFCPDDAAFLSFSPSATTYWITRPQWNWLFKVCDVAFRLVLRSVMNDFEKISSHGSFRTRQDLREHQYYMGIGPFRWRHSGIQKLGWYDGPSLKYHKKE